MRQEKRRPLTIRLPETASEKKTSGNRHVRWHAQVLASCIRRGCSCRKIAVCHLCTLCPQVVSVYCEGSRWFHLPRGAASKRETTLLSLNVALEPKWLSWFQPEVSTSELSTYSPEHWCYQCIYKS